MVQVTELSYMGIGVKDIGAWKEFATAVVGLELVDEGERDRCYLRMDYWHHRLILHEDRSDDVLYLGWRVAGGEEFAEMQQQLSAAGIRFRVGSEEEAAERRVLEILKLEDPDGHPTEIFHGPEVQFAKPFHPGRPMHGRFKTGAGGLGHCIVRQKDMKAAYRFYRALGMRGGVEYKIAMGPRVLTPVFMHCNERDHSIAFGISGLERRINHLMIEVDNLDDVGLTHDLVRSRNIPVTISLGKHSNDHMYSFYFRNPSGWIWEYGWGARPATHQSEYYVTDVYGHQFEAGGFDLKPE
jgi:2,3-dihydroxybiphenyl 1,2-dioxygenase